MKGLTTLSVFAFFYLLIIILFNEAAGEPRGVQNEDNVGQPSSATVSVHQDQVEESGISGTKNQPVIPSAGADEAKFGNVAKKKTEKEKQLSSSQKDAKTEDAKKQAKVRQVGVDPNSQQNDTNPLADLFQITDPNMRQAMNAIYGAYRGNDQCSRKAFCMMGNYMKDMPGRDIAFLVMGNYIPKEFSLYYEIFKVAVLYGQNCNVYVCIPGPDPNDADAASAAAPKPGIQQPTIPNPR